MRENGKENYSREDAKARREKESVEPDASRLRVMLLERMERKAVNSRLSPDGIFPAYGPSRKAYPDDADNPCNPPENPRIT
jgi:hypothetical protein